MCQFTCLFIRSFTHTFSTLFDSKCRICLGDTLKILLDMMFYLKNKQALKSAYSCYIPPILNRKPLPEIRAVSQSERIGLFIKYQKKQFKFFLLCDDLNCTLFTFVQNSFNTKPVEKIFLLITKVPMCDVVLVTLQHVNALRNQDQNQHHCKTFPVLIRNHRPRLEDAEVKPKPGHQTGKRAMKPQKKLFKKFTHSKVVYMGY